MPRLFCQIAHPLYDLVCDVLEDSGLLRTSSLGALWGDSPPPSVPYALTGYDGRAVPGRFLGPS